MAFSAPLPSTPPILPPGSVRVAGMVANDDGHAAFDGSAPITVSWNPVASATLYGVSVTRVFRDGDTTQFAPAGTLQVAAPATSIDIPAEVFAGGEHFFFRITAFDEGGQYGRGSLSLQAYPVSSAGTLTGLFRLDDPCGDGTVQAGEDCDSADVDASRDVDCTAPIAATLSQRDGGRADAAAAEIRTVAILITLPACGVCGTLISKLLRRQHDER
jgi:hypothetical protein